MAKFEIDENFFPIECLQEYSTEVVDGTSASAQSAAISADFIRIANGSAGAVQIAFGANPTATTSSMYLPAGCSELFRITSGQKVAALGGKISISIMV